MSLGTWPWKEAALWTSKSSSRKAAPEPLSAPSVVPLIWRGCRRLSALLLFRFSDLSVASSSEFLSFPLPRLIVAAALCPLGLPPGTCPCAYNLPVSDTLAIGTQIAFAPPPSFPMRRICNQSTSLAASGA